jgi:Zn-finger nucleic acid-binding protein
MERVTIGRTDVDRCVSCKGLWFDWPEDQDMLPYAKEIDTGDRKAGARGKFYDHSNCPVCVSTPMVPMVDDRQPHIQFESCPSCHGRYFDAGEFRDLGEHSFVDVIRDLFTRERK